MWRAAKEEKKESYDKIATNGRFEVVAWNKNNVVHARQSLIRPLIVL